MILEIVIVAFAAIGAAAIVKEGLKISGIYEMSIFKRYWNYMNTWREHRRIVKELNLLTDKELQDIGISRYDVDRLIWLEEDMTMRKRGENKND